MSQKDVLPPIPTRAKRPARETSELPPIPQTPLQPAPPIAPVIVEIDVPLPPAVQPGADVERDETVPPVPQVTEIYDAGTDEVMTVEEFKKRESEGRLPFQNSPVPPSFPNSATPGSKTGGKRLSPFTKSNRACAGVFVDITGTSYWYREIPPTVKEWLEKYLEYIADLLGIPVAQFYQDDYSGANPVELANLPETMEVPINTVIRACCVDWDAVDDDENPVDWIGADTATRTELIAGIGYEIRQAFFEQLVRSTKTGMSQDQFFRAGRLRFGQRR